MPKTSYLVLFRTDLRTLDNTALSLATQKGDCVTALFVLDNASGQTYGAASRWWLYHSLQALRGQLEALGIQLVLRLGDTLEAVKEVQRSTSATHIVWNRSYDPFGVAIGRSLKKWAQSEKLTAQSFSGALLHEPSATKTKSGKPFKVFTPFWRSYLSSTGNPLTIEQPAKARATNRHCASDDLASWRLLPCRPDWAKLFHNDWRPGETGAHRALEAFFKNGLKNYDEGRDFPAFRATSKLSPHLRFGEISPIRIWNKTKKVARQCGQSNADKFLAEIGWREFSHHLLFHFPDLKNKNFNPKFDAFSWYTERDKSRLLHAWQRGQTGYPIVDAGMRQLWQTGWMHNRVRMIVGSFLVKHLLIDWREGEKWFWETLVDACPANNTASWQWIAGCGADAAPYFRIFNPILQGEKFDKRGAYIEQFVPELARLPAKLIHKPWSGQEDELARYGVRLGETYPHPIVEHTFARQRALKTFQQTKQAIA